MKIPLFPFRIQERGKGKERKSVKGKRMTESKTLAGKGNTRILS